MEKTLLVVGIISIIACVLSLLYAALNRFGYYNILDAEADKYKKLHQGMIASFALGVAFAVVGIACLFIRSII